MKARGTAFGRKKRLTEAQVENLRRARKDGALIRELMEHHGLSKASVYRYLAKAPDAEA